MIATITHPLVGYETETVVWARYLGEGLFQPTIASAYGLGRGWGGIWPFLLAAGGALVLAACGDAAPAPVDARRCAAASLALLGWALFAALAPTLLGIDHAGLQSIVNAGDHTAFNLSCTRRRYPLKTLAPIAAVAGLLALAAMGCCAARRPPRGRGRRTVRGSTRRGPVAPAAQLLREP